VRNFVVLFATFLIILAGAGAAWSQTVQGVITGTITDPSGAVVPNATVGITNVATNISQTTTTGSDGSYRFPLVPPGTYTLVVKVANFAEVRASGVVVQASQTVPFSVRLELAKASAVIEVTSQAPLVQTATSDLGFQVDSKTIEHAALVDRDVFAALPFMAPQVSPGMDRAPTSGGARESGTSYMLNGSDDNNNFSAGAINISPPLESVEDFSIITNSMGAQYGRGAGAVVSANQKSGTNKFHGALYEQNRNASLNANNFFYNRDLGNDPTLAKKPKYIKNQFGGAVGGPIRKDKTFFFFAYDRSKLLSGAVSANNFAPTIDGLAYVQAHGGPLAKAVLAAYPPLTSDNACPNQPNYLVGPNNTDTGVNITGKGINPFTGLPNAVGCISFFDPQNDTQNVYYGRVDHNFSSSDRLSFAANITRDAFVDKFGGGGLKSNGAISNSIFNNLHNLTLNETHVFNPRLVNEVTISQNRNYNANVEGNGTADNVPNIFMDNQNEGNLNYQIGPFEGGQVVGFVQDRWQFQDNLVWTKGRHSVKFGGGGTSGILYRNWDLGLPGQYEFGQLYSVDAPPDANNNPAPCAATASCPQITPTSDGALQSDGTIAGVNDETHSNFNNDYPYFQETAIDPRTGARADAYRHYTYHDYAAFVQDDWKVTSRLTLNLGLRWERFGAPSEDHGILAQFTNIGSCDIINDTACIANARVNPVSRMWKTRNRDFGPRIGFAWDVFGNGKMAVRGGYGIYYDRIFDNIWSNGAWNPPFYALLDFQADAGDAINYSNPASIGSAYDPNGPNGPIPYPGKRVSVRTMDVHMKDSSGQNFYFGVERQVFGSLLLRASYQGAFGRHLPMLENYNRVDGIGYGVVSPSSLTPVRPNPLYTGFNYRSNSVSSNYNSLVVEAQKRMGHGLQFQTGYTYSKLLDVNSELFAGCSTIGGFNAPYYYYSNARPKLTYGRASYDHRYSYKFNVTYEMPFFKSEKGFVGHALGGWALGTFFQMYAGHPIDVYNGSSLRIRAKTPFNGTTCLTASGCFVRDQNGIPFNIGDDYNLDNVLNDHPDFIGTSLGSVYSGNSPADGFFTDNHKIGCGFPGMPANISVTLSSSSCTSTPNTLFANPAYPTGATPYLRFGNLGRNVFIGPRFIQMDLSLSKTFKLTESMNLRFSADAQNLANHPNFDCINGNLNSSTFGQAQCIVPFGLGTPKARVMALSLRFAF